MRRALVLACLLASVSWVFGRLLDERGLAASLLFYIPAPLVLLGLVLAAFLLRRRRGLSLAVAASALLPLMATLGEQRWSAPPPPAAGSGPSLSLLHWNVCRGYGGWRRLAREIAADSPEGSPDLVILSEVMSRAGAEELAALLPRLPYRQYGFPMLVLSRYPLSRIAELESRAGIRIYELTLRQEGTDWRFFALDVAGQPSIAREPALALLAAQIRERRPDFLAADFNTPRGSRLLSPLSPGYSHAYERAGHGWSYTWPTFFPVLAIDHLFLRDAALEATAYEIASSPWSDHRLQRARLRRRTAPE